MQAQSVQALDSPYAYCQLLQPQGKQQQGPNTPGSAPLPNGNPGADGGVDAGVIDAGPQPINDGGNGVELKVGPTEFRLLRFFMARPERVMTRQALLDGVWGDHVFIEERTVDVHVRRLRLALEPSGHDALVETVRGGGYRLRKQPLQ